MSGVSLGDAFVGVDVLLLTPVSTALGSSVVNTPTTSKATMQFVPALHVSLSMMSFLHIKSTYVV